jgi:complement component 1 Q subcomponent-binding protein
MFSLRALARAAPRAAPRLAAATPARMVLRTPAIAAARTPAAAGFSSTARALRGNNNKHNEFEEATQELAAKIESEIQFEKEIDGRQDEPPSIKEWLDNSGFELIDTPGRQDVKLVRDFNNEKITVTFSIGNLDGLDDMYDGMDEEGMNEDEDSLSDPDHPDSLSPSQRNNGNKRAKGSASRPAIEEEDDEDLDQDEDDLVDEQAMSTPLSLNVVIEKPGTEGSLSIDASTSHGALVIENVAYYDSAATAKGLSQDAMWAQQGVYAGPPFHTLDEDLQLLVERYLEERGIGQSLALFAIDYVDVKEQNEYLRWLGNFKKFVTA